MQDVRAPREEVSWWEAALAGDGAAFNRLFALHRDAVFRYARRLVDVPADADDIAAAAFLELWRRRDTVRMVEGSVKPWLLVTAGYLARNSRRRSGRWRRLLAELPREEAVPDPAEVALRRVSGHRGDSDLAAALRRLRPVDQTLLALTVFEGYSTDEAAAAVGLTGATARSRLSRARSRLRDHLRPEPAPSPIGAEEQR